MLFYTAYLQLSRRAAAVRRYLRDPVDYWIRRGDAARGDRNWRIAARYYRRALRRNPASAPIWIQYGHALKESGQVAEAETAYRRALEAAPNNADAHFQLGHLKKSQGDTAAAIACFTAALRCDKGHAGARHDLRGLDAIAEGGECAKSVTPSRTLAEEIAAQYWWHSIDLGNGIVTSGRKSARRIATEFANTFGKLDLTGRSVLDVGAWAGGFSVEAKRRGAARVVAVDHYTWNAPEFRGREAFDLVNRVTGFGLEAVDIDLDVPQLSLAELGTFDVVLFLGVFYHLRDPIAGLREVAALAREVLVVETLVERRLNPRPSMIFYPGNERDDDATNWWGPNVACMVELLRQVGFARIEITPGITRSRKVFHAFR
jgi:tRNA (mo5U34)-methyltransferase